MDTIYAEATPAGRGGVSVVRISGPDAWEAVSALAGSLPEPRRAVLRELRDGDELIDRALVIVFEEGRSFTGEQSAEIHLHGAPVIVARTGVALSRLGVRLAEAGEFTKRAFLNGKLDLAEAEGLADLLAAETEAQRKLAMRSVDGELSQLVEVWRRDLIRAGALIEVTLDFADEEVPEEVPQECYDLIDGVKASIQGVLEGYPAAERVRQGFEVAIIGPPNAGKSTLMNRIARRDIAIVSDIPGTTRDIIEFRADLNGLAVTFLDTAGLRESLDEIESIGIDRARSRAKAADLRLHLSQDGSFDQALWSQGDLVLRSKSDTGEGDISGVTGAGIADMLATVSELLVKRVSNAGIVSRERQAQALGRAVNSLSEPSVAPELMAEKIRRAAQDLETMVGRIGAEDYLDVVFSSFCIGK